MRALIGLPAEVYEIIHQCKLPPLESHRLIADGRKHLFWVNIGEQRYVVSVKYQADWSLTLESLSFVVNDNDFGHRFEGLRDPCELVTWFKTQRQISCMQIQTDLDLDVLIIK